MRINIFIVCVFAFTMHALQAQQVIQMDENDIDVTVLTWHYSKYEKSTSPNWSVQAQDGVGQFHCDFIYNDLRYEVIYDDSGFLLLEKEYMDIENIPQEIAKILDYRIVKYKVETLTKETTFENRKKMDVFYLVDARTKTSGIVLLWFDEQFKLVDNRDEN